MSMGKRHPDAVREAVIAAYGQGVSAREVARRHDVSLTYVLACARQAGINRRPGRPRRWPA